MAGVIFALAGASVGEWLAGVSAAEKVGSLNAAPIDSLDVAQVGDLRPVFGEHPAAVRFDLGVPDDVHPSPLEAEFEAADT
jgi:hypothetical protein